MELFQDIKFKCDATNIMIKMQKKINLRQPLLVNRGLKQGLGLSPQSFGLNTT
jgi:hypothetical protein